MAGMLSNFWNWITGKQEVLDLPPNLIFEKDVTSENNFWISCILNPSLEIKYHNGIVTKILDTDKCLIDGKYHYQPKTDREVRNFPYIEVNSAVRVSLYRKKRSQEQWQVASCFLMKSGQMHQATRLRANDSEHNIVVPNEPTVQIEEDIIQEEDNIMLVQVMGDMPKIVNLGDEATIQILFKNNSYAEVQELIDYKTIEGNKVQLSIAEKVNLPLTIGIQSQFIFDVQIKGKYVGKSTEKVEFFFKNITYKVGINIDVTDPRIVIPNYVGFFTKREIDMKKLFELQSDSFIPGVCNSNKIQFPTVKLASWNIPSQLVKCFWTEEGNYNVRVSTEVKEKIGKLYPAAFESLSYQNYKAKFHTLLFMEEIEVTISLQKYSQERIAFDHVGEFLVLKIPDLSEQRPSLIPGDRISVTDPPHCTKRLGKAGPYEGFVHKVLADEIWLKFDPEFHHICGHWDYSVNFFNARMMYRKQHEVVNELWKKNKLGESFLFPFKDTLEYQPPRLIILNLHETNVEEINSADTDNKNNSLVAPPKVIKRLRWFNEMLNTEQKNAVINILKGEGRPMPYVIYGPPGTGKTITLTESIIQVYKEFPKSKLLICAPTNAAVDMLLGKLIITGLFDKKCMKRLVGYNHFLSSSYNLDYDEYCVLPEFESAYKTECQHDEKLIKKKEILKLRIVITTEGTAGLLYMMGCKSGTFTHIFIDEAGQSMEPEILLPLSFLDLYRGGQVILAGDPKQLGPVVMSTLAKTSGLGQSLLARFINYPSYICDPSRFPEYNGYNPKVITHLIRNYRSLPEIVDNFSKLFYSSLLVATKQNDNVQERILLNNLCENVHWDVGCNGPIIVHGISGEDSQEPCSPSWFNPHEAFQVLLYTTKLIKAGLTADDIGIITPYAAQLGKINELLKMYHPDTKLPKVGTVEMFQGQERTVIIISMVRSKSAFGREKDVKFKLGFLAAKERTNVALSRGKSLVIIIGDPSTMLLNYYWKHILLQAMKNDNYIGCSVVVPDKKVNKKTEKQDVD